MYLLLFPSHASFHSDQMVLLMARLETGSCKRRLNWRATFSDDESTYSFLWVSDEGGVVVDEDDDDGMSEDHATMTLGTDKALLKTQF